VLDNDSPATGLEEVAKPPKPNRNAAKSCQDDVVRHMVRTLGKVWHIRSLVDGQNSNLPTWTTYTDARVPTTTGILENVLEPSFPLNSILFATSTGPIHQEGPSLFFLFTRIRVFGCGMFVVWKRNVPGLSSPSLNFRS